MYLELVDRRSWPISRAAMRYLRSMKKLKKGKIIFINSVAGRNGYPNSAAYVSSKYGLRGLFIVGVLTIPATGLIVNMFLRFNPILQFMLGFPIYIVFTTYQLFL